LYLSKDPEKMLKHTEEQMAFHRAMMTGMYDEGWLAGGNSAGKTWCAKFIGTHWGCYKFKPNNYWKNHDEYLSEPYNILCTGPESKQAMELWEAIEMSFKESPFLKYQIAEIHTGTRRKIHPYIKLKNGVFIEAIGLHDKGKHIEGQAYDLVLIQEPPDVRHLGHCLDKVLIPRTWRRGGVIMGFGTPKGKGEYYQAWRKGRRTINGQDNQYYEARVYSQYADSRTNPYANQEKIQRYLESKNDEYIAERIEGKFVDNTFSAFKDSALEKCIDDSLPKKVGYNTNHNYLHGVDFGRKVDYTTCITWDVSVIPHRQVNYYRKGGGYVSWEEIFNDLLDIYNEYKGEFIADTTASAGDMQSEWLDDLGIPYIPFNFSGPSKKVMLINNLQDYIARQMFRMPYIPQVMEELHSYPGDLQDKDMETDCVMGLALVAYGAREYGPLEVPQPVNR